MKLTERQINRLRELTNASGRLEPSRVVADAKLKSSPLHSLFLWDAKRAAERYWLARAREIIGSVTLVVTTNETTIKAPMYVRDPEAKGEGYRSVMALRSDPVNARESMVYTLEVAAGHLRRAYDLAQPLGLTSEIDQLLQQVLGVQRMVRSAA